MWRLTERAYKEEFMNRTEKSAQLTLLEEKINQTPYLYIANPSGLTVAQVNRLRQLCFEQNIEYRVFKNTLIRKALERQEDSCVADFPDSAFQGASALLFTEVSAASIAKLVLGFHKELNIELPTFKAACLSQEVYQGVTFEELSQIKGKKERIAEVISLLQAPIQRVVGQLQAPQRLLALLEAIQQKS